MSSLAVPHTDTVETIQTPSATSPALSPSATAVDLTKPTQNKTASMNNDQDQDLPSAFQKASEKDGPDGCEIKLSQRKKWSLLAVFSLAFFIDVWSYSAFFILTGPISTDLDVKFEQQSWVITSYAVTFSSFLLFWGRVSDLYSAKPVFTFGFIGLGIMNLIISFLPDKYSFFVLRAISGIFGAALIPSAFRLIVAVFEPHELGKAFTWYGMSGAIANVTGVIVAGFVEYIPNGGQMAAWRWFFRILAILILPVAVGSLYWVPKPTGAVADVESKFKRLDLVGAFSMLLGIVLLILGLTLGASNGWKTAAFLVPFLLSWVLFAVFFVWESRIPEDHAILPPSTWKIPNFAITIIFALYIYSWWSLLFLPMVEVYVRVHGEPAIIAAVRLLPQGIAAAGATVLLTIFPSLVANPRWPIIFGTVFGIVGYILYIISNGNIGADYWRFEFTGGFIGSFANMVAFTGVNVATMTSVKPEMAGVAGAVLQVALQVGSAVALSIQAGLLTIEPGNLENWVNVRTSFIFVVGWGVVWLIAFIIFFKPKKLADAEQGKPVAHMG